MSYITAAGSQGIRITNTVSGHAVWYKWATLHAVGVTSIEDFNRPWKGLLMTIRPDRTLSNTHRRGGTP